MDKNRRRITILKIWRRSIQILSFLILPGLFTSIFYAMEEIYVSVITGKFSFEEMTPQVVLFAGSIFITILLGRFFCGFLCSFGAMGDLLWVLSQKTIKPKWKTKEKADSWLKRLKYILLISIIFGIWTWNIGNIDSMASPWTVFGIYLKISSWSSLMNFLSIGGLLLLLIILGSLFVERFFCRYLCPLGAVFAITSRFRLFHIIKKREHCGSCRMCTNKCSMGIPLYQYDTVTSGECINCFACTVHCPRQNAKANAAPVVVSVVSTAAMFGLFYAGNILTEAQNKNTELIAITQQTKEGNYIDGIYTGSGQGFGGVTKTSVTVENGNIADITIESYEDDDEYFNRAKKIIISEIIESQDVNVDAVSGATFSSNGIMESVADALGITKNMSNDINKEESDTKEDSIEDQSILSDNAAYQDGTYSGIGKGTEVSVTVQNGEISDITVTSYKDDEEYFTRAKESIIQQIIQNQNITVDAVSGATNSSNGIMEAVADALGISYTNTNSDVKEEGQNRNNGKESGNREERTEEHES